MTGVGVDIVENQRIGKLLSEYSEQFLRKLLTSKEISNWEKRGKNLTSLCGIYAAKEAVIKAVSCADGSKINFAQIEISHQKENVPFARVLGTKLKLLISISHEKSYTVAVAICDKS